MTTMIVSSAMDVVMGHAFLLPLASSEDCRSVHDGSYITRKSNEMAIFVKENGITDTICIDSPFVEANNF
jgi:hypothetical protein